MYDLPDVTDAKAVASAGDINAYQVGVITDGAFCTAEHQRGDLGRYDRVVGKAIPMLCDFEGLGEVAHTGTALTLRTMPI